MSSACVSGKIATSCFYKEKLEPGSGLEPPTC